MPTLDGAVVLVTGSNGGLGVRFVHEALARGASKVYASARRPQTWDDERIVPVALDVTDAASIRGLAEVAGDVTVLISNAGLGGEAPLLESSEADIRAYMETNFFGPVFLARAFAPILAANDEATLVHVLSVSSWLAAGGAYAASKAALWSATNSLRLELAPAGVHVVGVHMGLVDTPMVADVQQPKMSPAELVTKVYDAVEGGAYEVLADELAVSVKAALSGPLEALYPQLHGTTH